MTQPRSELNKKSWPTIYKIAAASVSALLSLTILLGADLYLHYKHGVNLWGYRGAAVGRKQPREKRVAVLGGSTTWGYGLTAEQSFPAQLQSLLADQNSASPNPITILNLGFNNEGSYSFPYTLNDYDYLDCDAVVIYSGYNDLGQPNLSVFRHRSPVFLRTGYLPLLPTLAADKIDQWRNRGPNGKVVFKPTISEQANTSPALARDLGSLTSAPPAAREASAQCPAEWQFYCDHLSEAADLALKKGKRVLVVGEPYISDLHVAQQSALATMLRARYSNQPTLRYLDLGRVVDLRDKSLCWDGMHLTAEGNRRIAAALKEPVLALLQD